MARALTLLLALGACAKPSPSTAAEPAALRLPAGCEASLAGRWALTSDSSYLYDASDDGTSVEFRALRAESVPGFEPRRFRADAGGDRRAGIDAGPVAVVHLARTDGGFVGATRARLTDARGQTCDVAFSTEVASCADGGLRLRTEAFADVDEDCRQRRTSAAPLVEHQLRRVSAP